MNLNESNPGLKDSHGESYEHTKKAPDVFLGEPSQFSIELTWIDSPDVRSPAERATWANLKVVAGNTPLTKHIKRDGSVADSIEVSPLALSTWILEHWNVLFSSSSDPLDEQIDNPYDFLEEIRAEFKDLDSDERERYEDRIMEWAESHRPRSADLGSAVPDLVFWRHGGRLVLAWRNDEEPVGPMFVRYTPGQKRVAYPRRYIAEIFAKLAKHLSEKLSDADVSPASDLRLARFNAGLESTFIQPSAH